MLLVLSSLGEEEETLAGLSGVCSICMPNFLRLLVTKVCCEVLMLKGDIAKPEILLREDETPNDLRLGLDCGYRSENVYLLETRPLVVQDAFIDGLRRNGDLPIPKFLLLGHRGDVGCGRSSCH